MDIGLATAAFWSAGAALAYTYLGYPALLGVIGRRGNAARRPEAGTPTPAASVIVAAYNEERCIAAKIANLLEQRESLEVIVVSDGSTDDTDAVVRRLSGPRVRLLVQAARVGKNMALNRGAREARGEILVFSDANAMLAADSLRQLLLPFDDPRVGLVSGQGLYGDPEGGTAGAVSNAYVRYESFLKTREGALGFVAAADGALYAMRRECYRELRADEVHDLLHPMQVSLQRLRCVFAPEAYTVEPPSSGAEAEFRRHVRIIAQGFVALLGQAPALLRRGCFRELWMLLSHRFLRWTSSFFLVTVLVTNLVLKDVHPIYAASLAGQGIFYFLAAAGAGAEALRSRIRLLAVPYYFCLVSAAGVRGLIEFLRGRGHATWLPVARTQPR